MMFLQYLLIISFIIGNCIISTFALENVKLDASSAENREDSILQNLLSNFENILQTYRDMLDVTRRKVPLHERYCPTCDKPVDCSDIKYINPCSTSGVYEIWPRSRVSSKSVNVYCDMEDEGGAWTIIQRRGQFGGSGHNFVKMWNEYKQGFGNVTEDFWIGNDNIFALTNYRLNNVKIMLTDWSNRKTYATYDEFWIDGELSNYKLHVKGHKGTARDFSFLHNGKVFSTGDRLNGDDKPIVRFGGWWFNKFTLNNLNAWHYDNEAEANTIGITWDSVPLKETEIKIRPKSFKIQRNSC